MPQQDDAQQRYDQLAQEHRELQDRYMRLLMNRARDERAHRAATRKALWAQMLATYRRDIASVVKNDLGRLCGRIEMLPQRPGSKQTAELKRHGEQVRQEIDAAESTDTNAAISELDRLKTKVMEQAQRIGTGHTLGDFCECAGCELIRAVEDARDKADHA